MIISGISSTQQKCLFHFVLHLPEYVQNYQIFINISNIFWQQTHKEQKKEICRKSSSVTKGAQHITKE